MSDSDRTKLIPGNVSNTNLCIYACSNHLSLENGPPTQQRTERKGRRKGEVVLDRWYISLNSMDKTTISHKSKHVHGFQHFETKEQ